MKITIKGQITIPQSLRERYGLLPGTEVEFIPDKNGVRLRPQKTDEEGQTTFDAWLAIATDSAETTLTTV